MLALDLGTIKESNQLDGLGFRVSRRIGHAVRIARPHHGVIRENPRLRAWRVGRSPVREVSDWRDQVVRSPLKRSVCIVRGQRIEIDDAINVGTAELPPG